MTTGPLGQGIANAVGMAMAERFLAEHFNRPGYELVDHHTYAICSDGDMMEGVSQEAASIAGHFGLGKLIVCYDDNRITIDGTTSISFDTENHVARMHADGWHVQRVEDSEDVHALHRALLAARAETERPSFISVRSHIAYPAPNAVDTAKAHGAPLGEEEVRATKQRDGLRPRATFHVEERVYEHMSLRDSAPPPSKRGGSAPRLGTSATPSSRGMGASLVRSSARGWQQALPSFAAGEQSPRARPGRRRWPRWPIRTDDGRRRGRPGRVHQDRVRGRGRVLRVHVGRNIPFGIREHAMGAIVNGLAAHGGMVKPYGSTFLIFSDYMRGAVRLSALMGLPVLWVWTHDSSPRRGRTHPPARGALRALRAIPHLWVMRPADANETALAWKSRWSARTAPSRCCSHARICPCSTAPRWAPSRVLTRCVCAVGVRGRRPGEGATAKLILIATGSEVATDARAGRDLAEQGTRVRVVSMPCMELFEAQSRDYRDNVIPRDVPRLAIEAGVSMSWWKWVGDSGDVIGIDTASAHPRRAQPCSRSLASPPTRSRSGTRPARAGKLMVRRPRLYLRTNSKSK